MAIVTTPLGFQKPDGTELVRGGDNVITANAAKAEELHQDARGRLTVIEAKNLTQDTAIAAARTNAVTDAKTYTDERDEAYRTVDRALWRAEDDTHQAAAEANSKTYTDAQDAAYRTVDRALWRSEDDGHQAAAEANAATYTDSKDTANRSAWAAADAIVLTNAKAHADAGLVLDRARLTSLEAVSPKISNIALDTDGNPYYSPGSTEVHVIPDGDGEPYYITFLQASADTDGTPYF